MQQSRGEKNKEDALEKLVKEAHQVSAANPDRAKALEYFRKALNAPARHGREDADTGRRTEIEAAIRKIEGK